MSQVLPPPGATTGHLHISGALARGAASREWFGVVGPAPQADTLRGSEEGSYLRLIDLCITQL